MFSRSGAYALPLLAVLVWGGMFPVTAGALAHVDGVHLTAVRYVVAATVLVVLLVATQGRAALRPDGRLGELLLLGTVGVAGFNLLVNLALGYTAPQNAALMVALTPVLTLLVRWVRDGVRPTAAMVGLMVAALFGVALVITHGRLADFSSIGAGDAMTLLGVLGWAIYTHGAGRFQAWTALRYTTLTQLVGAGVTVLVAVLADLAGLTRPPVPAAFGAVAWQLGYVALGSSVLAVLVWSMAIRRLGVPNVALFMNLVPVVAFTIQIARGYQPVPAELVGAALTVGALVLTNRLTRRAATVPAGGPVAA
ncbi:MAG: DMT family transporter, partial [Actinocatenispora sp.]